MIKKILFFAAILSCLFLSSNTAHAQCAVPTVQGSNIQISYKYSSGTAVTITWARGNGAHCIVALKKSSSGLYGPPSSTSANYSPNASYGAGSSLGGGDNFVVYDGTGTGVYVYNLAPNTIYDAYVYEYNTCTIFGTTYYFNTSTSSGYGFNTLEAPASSCGSLTSATSITGSSATINFAPGGGSGRFITMCPSNLTANGPANGYNYAVSVVYGSGALLGSARAMYNNSGTSVAVTGLTGATNYKVYDYEYTNGSYPTYSTYEYNTKNYISCNTYTFNTVNVPPTVNTVSSYTVCENTFLTTANLSGIGDGSTNENQNLTVTASSNNPTLFPSGSISVNYSSPNTIGYVNMYPANGQYGTAIITVTVNDGWSVNNITTTTFTLTVMPFPSPAGTISGSSPICAGSTQVYSVGTIANTTTYNWSVPSTFTITGGAGTKTITVTTTSASTSGNISVYGSNTNGCGNGTSSSKSIQVDMQPADPNAGPDQPVVCSNAAFTNATATVLPDSGWWSWLPGPSALIGNVSSNQTSVNPLNGSPTPNTYKLLWAVKRNGSVCPVKKDTLILTADFNNAACTPVSAFSYGPSSDVAQNKVCINTLINFVDLSVSADTWLWDFKYAGSVGTFTSSAQNPSFTYATTGTYTVYLKIHSNTTGLDYSSTQVLNVIDAPAAPGTISGNTSGICEGGSSGQQGYSISGVSDATGYTWAVTGGGHIDSYPSPTSILASFGNGATSGNISVTANNSCGSSSAATLSVTINPLPNTAGNNIAGPSTVCQGQSLATYSVSIANATTYLWTDISGTQTNTTNTFTTNVSSSATNGQISVIGSNACGTGDTAVLVLTINPLPVNGGSISGLGTIGVCPAPSNVMYVLSPAISNVVTPYTWGLPAGASIVGGNGMDTVILNYSGTTPGGFNQISVYGTNGCGMSSVANFSVFVNTPSPAQLCMVTVDSSGTHNVLYWDKTTITNADSFKIYREDVTSVYTHIGTVPYNHLSEYHDLDPVADPNTTTKRYKISSVDSCGNETALSPFHNTIYIIDNGSGQFSWPTLYTIEGSPNPVTNYVLMVDTNNTGFWKQIASTAGTQQVIVDVNYFNYVNAANWRVETVWGISCVSTQRTISGVASAIVRSKSNISNNRATAGIKNNKENSFTVYPNPTNGDLAIAFPGANQGKTTIKITSLLGEEVYSETFLRTNNKLHVDLSNHQSGTYLVQIINGNSSVTKRVVKN